MKRIKPENLPDLEERAKALGISLEKAVELVNCIQIDKPVRPQFRKGTHPNHHLIFGGFDYWYVHYYHNNTKHRVRLSKDVEEARRMRDEIFKDLGYQ